MRIEAVITDPIEAFNFADYVENLTMSFVDKVVIEVEDDKYKVTLELYPTQHSITNPEEVETLLRNAVENLEVVKIL